MCDLNKQHLLIYNIIEHLATGFVEYIQYAVCVWNVTIISDGPPTQLQPD